MAKSNSQVTTLDDAPDTSTDVAASAASPQEIGTNHDDALSGDRQVLTIHMSDLEGGHEAVNVAINGYAYSIPRGKPVSVPVEVVHILENAITTSYAAKDGGGTTERSNPRYAYSLGAIKRAAKPETAAV
jgi:hypothetical protein